MRRQALLVLVALLALLAIGGGSGASALPSGFQETTVFTGLTEPAAIEFAADGRVFVAEKDGRIKVFDGLGDGSPDLFGDLSANVHNFWDRGMLGFALDPDFTTGSPYVYVLYTYDAPIGGSPPTWGDECPSPPGPTGDGCVVSARLSRLTAAGNFMTGPEQVLINDWCQQYPSHSIGSLGFGADGALYVSGGDGASFNFADWGQDGNPRNPCGDPPGGVGATLTPPTAEGGALRSQDLRTPSDPTSLDGAILRVNPDTGQGMPDNPLAASSDPNARRIIAYGLRNPFRMTIRPGTNEVWLGDVGWNSWEEINRIADPLGSVENFGWPCYEGSDPQSSYDSANLTICENLYPLPGGVVAPYFAYEHSAQVVPGESCPTGSSSTAGVAFYPNGPFPDTYDGALFFADYSRNCIWVMFAGGNGLPNPSNRATFHSPAASPVDLQVGPDGALYYADFNGGTIRRIQYGSTPPPPPPPPPPSCPAGQYSAQYFANMTLSGTPTTERCEAAINYDWSTGSPAPNVPDDQFSTRWTGTFSFQAGSYQFTATGDDGIRVWVDGVLLINGWVDQGPTTYQETRTLTGGDHEVKVEYYENGGGAVAQVSWVNSGGGGDTTPPDAPTGLAASVNGSTADLSWSAASDNVGVTRYNVHRSTTSGFVPSVSNRIAQPTGTSYTDSGLAEGTHYYLVTAADAAGNVSAPSGQATATVREDMALGRPASASSVEAPGFEAAMAVDGSTTTRWSSTSAEGEWWQVDLGNALTVDTVSLNWETAYASKYQILTSLDGTSFAVAAEQTIDSAGWKTTAFADRSARYVRVLGITRATPYGISLWDANVFGPADTSPPSVPALSATVVGSSANLSWSAASDNVGVTRYNVHRSTTSGFVPSASNRIAQPTGTSYTDAGLAQGTYYYLVTAEDAAGNLSPPSNQASATIVNDPPTASIATPSATTTWKVDDLISFSGSSTDPEQGTLPASALSWTLIMHHCPSNCHTHTLQTWSGVASGSFNAPDHEYPSHLELRLTATDSAGESDTDSVELQPQTAELSFATQPSGFQLVVGSTSAATPFTRTVIVGSANSVSATTPQSQGGTQYAFSSWSDGGAQTHNIVANATATYTATYDPVDTQPPSAPSGFLATAVSSSQINLAWTGSTDNVGVTGYRVERCQGADCTGFVQVATPTGTTYNDTLLEAATSYSYRVRATDVAGNLSDYSVVQSATTEAGGLCSRSSAVRLTGMEHGVVSTAGGGIFSSLAGTPTADNTIARSGAYSLRIADASAASTVRALRSFTASSVVVTRFAVRLSSLPSVTSNLAYVDSGTDLVFRYNAATQRFQLVLGASTATSATTVSAATWYLIDLRYDLSGNLHLADWRVDGVTQTQVSRNATPATANGFGVGATANASVYTANYDDIFVATQPTAYPLADSRIVRLVPGSMGTSAGAGNFRNDDGTAIDANSWQRLDDVPMASTTDYVRQQANSGTSYVEFGLQDTPETCIREVSAVLTYHAAGTSADRGKTSIFDGLTEAVVFSGDMSQTGLQYKTAVVAPAAGIWNQAALNGLVARVGYSTDSSPNPYWDSIMVEVAVP